jgi:AraC-like DNA-binding protein
MNNIIDNEIIKAVAIGGEALVDGVVNYIATRDIEELAELTVEGIARCLMTSRSNLHYLFNKFKNMTPGEFLTHYKLSRGVTLLEDNPRLSITELSQKVGFYTVDYFIRIFINHFGITPGKYRMYMRIDLERKKRMRKLIKREKKDKKLNAPLSISTSGWRI